MLQFETYYRWRPRFSHSGCGHGRRLGKLVHSQFRQPRLERALCMSVSRKEETPTHPTTDIEGLVSITLEEAFWGKQVPVTLQRRVRGFRVYIISS